MLRGLKPSFWTSHYMSVMDHLFLDGVNADLSCVKTSTDPEENVKAGQVLQRNQAVKNQHISGMNHFSKQTCLEPSVSSVSSSHVSNIPPYFIKCDVCCCPPPPRCCSPSPHLCCALSNMMLLTPAVCLGGFPSRPPPHSCFLLLPPRSCPPACRPLVAYAPQVSCHCLFELPDTLPCQE